MKFSSKNKGIVIVLLITGAALLLYFFYIKPKQEVKEVMEVVGDKNVNALLDAIAWAEGTDRDSNNNKTGYDILYGGKKFTGYSDHPYLTKQWAGVKLTDEQCKGAGLKAGCITTAAGRYQFTQSTWKNLKSKLGLKDFGPQSQDLAAIELIRAAGALDDIKSGRFTDAVNKIKKIWASMPGANYQGQPTKKMTDLLAWYKAKGGTSVA